MFTLVIIEDKFKITPDQFDEELKDVSFLFSKLLLLSHVFIIKIIQF